MAGVLSRWTGRARDRALSGTILVAGSGRSGTTWLSRIVAEATDSASFFEPFVHDARRRFTHVARAETRTNRQIYIPARSRRSPHDEALWSILTGRAPGPWERKRDPDEATAGRRVIKAIRANLFLGYLARRWPALRIVLVVRNPLGAVGSQLARTSEGWDFHFEADFVLDQPRLVSDWLEPHLATIREATGAVERAALKWCIENRVPLGELRGRRNVRVVSYDRLVADPRRWGELGAFLRDRNWSAERCAAAIAAAPAPERADGSARSAPSTLDAASRQAIRRIVERFGLEAWLDAQDPRAAGVSGFSSASSRPS